MKYRTAKTTLVVALLSTAGMACSKKDTQTPVPSQEVTPTGAGSASAPAADSTSAPAPSPSAALAAPPARGDDADRKSKNGQLQAEIGGVPVLVQYGRPEVRGRALFGSLIPYGKIWRTGADEATTITLRQDAMIEGQKVPAGTYALFTVPAEGKWTVVLNRTAKQWGAYKYDASQDLIRVDVSPMQKEHTEALTFVAEGSTLVLKWGTVAVPIQIQGAG